IGANKNIIRLTISANIQTMVVLVVELERGSRNASPPPWPEFPALWKLSSASTRTPADGAHPANHHPQARPFEACRRARSIIGPHTVAPHASSGDFVFLPLSAPKQHLFFTAEFHDSYPSPSAPSLLDDYR